MSQLPMYRAQASPLHAADARHALQVCTAVISSEGRYGMRRPCHSEQYICAESVPSAVSGAMERDRCVYILVATHAFVSLSGCLDGSPSCYSCRISSSTGMDASGWDDLVLAEEILEAK